MRHISRFMASGEPPPWSEITEYQPASCDTVWAEGSPFEFKDQLKSRGYRWNGEENGRPRAWYIDVTDEQREAELAFLKKEIYQRDIDLKPSRITAYERFSERV